MNYLSQNYGNASIFYPNNTGWLGSFTKLEPSHTLVTVDYSQAGLASGVSIQNVAFLLDIQTNPQLIISNRQIAGAGSLVLSFIISGGYGGVDYKLSIVATLSDATVRTDVVEVKVEGDDDMDCGCPPFRVVPIPKGYQQAQLSQDGVYATGFIRYYVQDTPPLGPNVMDQWWDTTSNMLLEYATDGVHSFWYNFNEVLVTAQPSTSLYYQAGAGQTVFDTTLPDAFGRSYIITSLSIVVMYVNGVRLMPNTGSIGDYNLDATLSRVTFLKPLVAGDIVTLSLAESTLMS
jgi:hypothetical protein